MTIGQFISDSSRATGRAGEARLFSWVVVSMLAFGVVSCSSATLCAEDAPVADPATAVAAGERAVSWIAATLVQPDGLDHELGEELRRRIACAVLGLRPVIEGGPDVLRRRAFVTVSTLGDALGRYASLAEESSLLCEVRSLESAVAPWLGSADPVTAASATSAYPAVADAERAAAALGRALDRPEREIRLSALAGLRTLGRPAWPHVPKILALVRDADLHEAATRALVGIGPEPGALVDALSDPDSRVRAAALEACTRPSCLVLAAEVARGLEDPEPEVRRRACEALGGIGAANQALRVAARLQDDDERVRWAAAAALGKFDAAAAQVAPQLGAVLRSPDAQLVRQTLATLERLGEKAGAALPEVVRLLERLPPEHAVRAARAAARLSSEWRDTYVRALAIPPTLPAERRRLAAAALGSPFDARGVGALVRALDDPDRSVQEAAATSLGRVGGAAASAVPALEAVLADAGREAGVHREAKLAIAAIRGATRREGRR